MIIVIIFLLFEVDKVVACFGSEATQMIKSCKTIRIIAQLGKEKKVLIQYCVFVSLKEWKINNELIS